MELKVLGLITVTGTEAELAIYSAILIDVLGELQENKRRKAAESDVASVAEMLKKNFAEMQKKMKEANDE